MTIPSRTLPNGDEMPQVGAGTWDIGGETVKESVRAALDAGYTHVDTAEGYKNEAEIGDVLAEYDREELFLTSKVLPSNLHYESVLESCEASLDRLGTDYLDLYLIHWPNPTISLRETMQALERLHEEGKVRNVGVSNFSKYQLMFALKVADVPIAVNQVEFHPWLYQEDLLQYCEDNDVVLTAAAPLARTEVLEDPVVRDVAEEYDRTPAQVVLRWQVQKGVVTIPKSSTPEHIRSNFEVSDWELDADDVARIDDIDTEKRVYMIDVDDETYGIPR
ncbi:aldo/keto reductase [Halopelagius longus]|uniref:Aldo/keto reductase n=1 Tax=Halopelagius longus TaxID=1236180 RepID=A0A1H0Y677_9EURY|nr:aldo/keto reductase [Halopelagius longus]RDI72297.1 aldo/keto reductase [Halopelagius longus]SDQ10573.1 Aldo/keto reductase [Halopelagius longus]